jgi:DNA-binding PadR family transcriptional regulator
MHPYEVAQTLRTRAKHESIRLNYGSLYAVVDSLESRQLIRSTGTVRDGRRPERTIYELTDEGARELVDWLSDLIATPVKEYLQFEAALSFIPVLPPEDVVTLLLQRVAAIEVRLGQQRGGRRAAEERGLPRLFLLEDEYQEQLLQAELHFVETLVKEIQSGALEGLQEWQRFADGSVHAWDVAPLDTPDNTTDRRDNG